MRPLPYVRADTLRAQGFVTSHFPTPLHEPLSLPSRGSEAGHFTGASRDIVSKDAAVFALNGSEARIYVYDSLVIELDL